MNSAGEAGFDGLRTALVDVMRSATESGLSFPQLLAEAENEYGLETEWQHDRVFPSSYGDSAELVWRVSANTVRWNQRGSADLLTLSNAQIEEGMRVASARMLSGMDDALDDLCEVIVRYAVKAATNPVQP